MEGIVKWFDSDKGYGFIRYDDRDIFVHFTQINEQGYKTLKEGDKVKFEIFIAERGLQAKNVIKC